MTRHHSTVEINDIQSTDCIKRNDLWKKLLLLDRNIARNSDATSNYKYVVSLGRVFSLTSVTSTLGTNLQRCFEIK